MDYEIKIGPLPFEDAKHELARLFGGVETIEIYGSEGQSWSGSTKATGAHVQMDPVETKTYGEKLLGLARTAGFEGHVTPLGTIWAGGGATWRMFRTKAGGEWGMANVMLETTDLGRVLSLARTLARQDPPCTVELFVNDNTTYAERRAGKLAPDDDTMEVT